MSKALLFLLSILALLLHGLTFVVPSLAKFVHHWGGTVTLACIIFAVVLPLVFCQRQENLPFAERLTLGLLSLGVLSYSLKTISIAMV